MINKQPTSNKTWKPIVRHGNYPSIGDKNYQIQNQIKNVYIFITGFFYFKSHYTIQMQASLIALLKTYPYSAFSFHIIFLQSGSV
jgi:hypothetical protein